MGPQSIGHKGEGAKSMSSHHQAHKDVGSGDQQRLGHGVHCAGAGVPIALQFRQGQDPAQLRAQLEMFRGHFPRLFRGAGQVHIPRLHISKLHVDSLLDTLCQAGKHLLIRCVGHRPIIIVLSNLSCSKVDGDDGCGTPRCLVGIAQGPLLRFDAGRHEPTQPLVKGQDLSRFQMWICLEQGSEVQVGRDRDDPVLVQGGGQI
mmetsp:Transcript_219/g.436  ORF Transcript_219/g.436 Transcript_219/m.436 type:complete len:203 (-) Transcript_219:309-917(-)